MRTFLFPADLDDRVSTETGKSSPQVALEKKPWGKGFSPGFSSFLDFSRWLAALVVFIGHLRTPVFIGYPDLPSDQRSYLVGALYFLSGLGGSSVIVFLSSADFSLGASASRR